jgi:hypothetical protein
MRDAFPVGKWIIKRNKTINNLMSSFITTWRNSRLISKKDEREAEVQVSICTDIGE